MPRGHLASTVSILALACLLSGCAPLGPRSVVRDRFDYNTAISNSWKEQTLLNIVKIRYADMPLFVDVASVVAGYTMEAQVSAGAAFPDTDTFGGDTYTIGASGRFTDRPTITYTPITGQQFNRSFMTPITPKAVLFLMQSGWPADLVFPIAVDSMNGLRSQVAAGANRRQGDDAFYRAIALLREIQVSGAVGMRIQQQGEKETTMMLFHRDGIAPEVEAALGELGALLNIEQGSRQLDVTYSQIPQSKRELAMLTRSMLQIMMNMATLVDVPEEDAREGRTPPSLPYEEGAADTRPIRIRFSRDRPEDAFTAVKYRDQWFYIDDRDFKSKRTFAFLMILFSLTETGGREDLPLVTIPAA
ncbi:MAG: hypothetical protein ACYTGG_02335 [Planctomycetota bacterium]|jgi:hypothetical protein